MDVRRCVTALAVLWVLVATPALAQDPSTTITISGTISGSPATVLVNGVNATITGSMFTASNVPLIFGANTVTAVATDAAGNSASHQITVHLATRMTIQGTVSESTASVTVNGVPATVTAGTYTASVPLQLGLNTVTATATDAAGNVSTTPAVANIYVAHAPIEHP